MGEYNPGMDLHAELARLNAAPELPEWVIGTVQKLLDQAQKDAAQSVRRDTELHAAKTKIQALTLELMHLRRMRFGASSEAFSVEERDLFQDTLASDLAAAEAELAKKQAEALATSEPQAPRAPRARGPLPRCGARRYRAERRWRARGPPSRRACRASPGGRASAQ